MKQKSADGSNVRSRWIFLTEPMTQIELSVIGDESCTHLSLLQRILAT